MLTSRSFREFENVFAPARSNFKGQIHVLDEISRVTFSPLKIRRSVWGKGRKLAKVTRSIILSNRFTLKSWSVILAFAFSTFGLIGPAVIVFAFGLAIPFFYSPPVPLVAMCTRNLQLISPIPRRLVSLCPPTQPPHQTAEQGIALSCFCVV